MKMTGIWRMKMISYDYYCIGCGWEDEILVKNVADRDRPCSEPCPSCEGVNCVRRQVGSAAFNVPEGACGNAANGYSEYFGDSQIAKAKSPGERMQVKKYFGK